MTPLHPCRPKHPTPAPWHPEFAVDYAWAHPPVKALRSNGVRAVGRYLSHDDSKDVTYSEARALSAAGISIFVVWESTAQRAGEGSQAGHDDAIAAHAKAHAAGMPSTAPIYFAVDYDADPAAVVDYFKGVAHELPPARIGVYGGIRVGAHLLDLRLVGYFWQTIAWSAGALDHRAAIYQYSENHDLGGVSVDYNQLRLPRYGGWQTR